MKVFHFTQSWYEFVIIALVCYFVGCFNFARFISKKKDKDITTIGSGNPGTMNMTREFGIKIGVLTFFCDALKGGVPAVICYFIYRKYVFADSVVLVGDFIRYFCGFWVVVGHIFPVTTHFKGGKGIASTLGLFWFSLACENVWWIALGFAFLMLVVLYIYHTEWGSMGSLLGVTGFSIMQSILFVLRYDTMPVDAYQVCVYALILGINLFAWLAHKQNLKRVLSGEEHHTSLKKLAKKKGN